MPKKNKVALIYDFDETLSTTYMQEYTLIPEFGMSAKEFWHIANTWGEKNGVDQITSSMYWIKKVAESKGINLTKSHLRKMGKSIEFFPGVEDWFERINRYGKYLGLDIEHYIISAGITSIIKGCSIVHNFKDIYGCSYAYDENDRPVWPARVVNHTTKTQYISKINKGLGALEDRAVNEFYPDEKRRIPYTRMIYFGDGMTDVPSMKSIKKRNGYAIAVYDKHKGDTTAVKLLKEDRVNFALLADYRDGKHLDTVTKTILNKMATERDLDLLKAKEKKKCL
ncbi:MAG: haloacid dehalogenase-like hydrolase [Alphaproteobacteria bacterium]